MATTKIALEIYVAGRSQPIDRVFSYSDVGEPIPISTIQSDVKRIANSGFFHQFEDGTNCYFTPYAIQEVHWVVS